MKNNATNKHSMVRKIILHKLNLDTIIKIKCFVWFIFRQNGHVSIHGAAELDF